MYRITYLASLVTRMESVRREIQGSEEAIEELTDIHGQLQGLVEYYKSVLVSHSIELPFS